MAAAGTWQGFSGSTITLPMAWIYIVAGGVFEAAWALALKESHGFSRLWPTAAFLAALVVSMVLLGLGLRSLPVGTGYAVWVGIGAVGAAVGGVLLYGEGTEAARMLPIALIGVGVVWLALGES